jgi:hypothetical protein
MGDPERLLARMRATKAGWGQDDIHTLLTDFGFICEQGAKHRLYSHSKYPELYMTVARHNSLAKGYISTAVRLVDRLKKMEAQNEQ